MSRSQTTATIAFMLLVLLVVPATAVAAIPPPPGNSAADQYAETYPGAGGNQPTAPPATSDPAGALGPETAQGFEQAGPDGRQAAAVAAATAPQRPAELPFVGRQGSGEPAVGVGGGSGPLEVVRRGLGTSGSDGIGTLLPLLLAAIVMAAVAFVLVRLRQTAPE